MNRGENSDRRHGRIHRSRSPAQSWMHLFVPIGSQHYQRDAPTLFERVFLLCLSNQVDRNERSKLDRPSQDQSPAAARQIRLDPPIVCVVFGLQTLRSKRANIAISKETTPTNLPNTIAVPQIAIKRQVIARAVVTSQDAEMVSPATTTRAPS